jgi:plasmid maintenance system antidote protein VapI
LNQVAAAIGVSQQALSTMMNGQTNLIADIVMRMQISYDLAKAHLQLAG